MYNLDGESVLVMAFSLTYFMSQSIFTSTPAFKNSITQSVLSAMHAKWNGVQPLLLYILMIEATGFRHRT